MTEHHDDDEARAYRRLVALVERELGADDVRVVPEGGDAPPEAPNALLAPLPDGRRLVVTFAVPPAEPEVLRRRLQILALTFAQTAEEPDRQPVRLRTPIARLLHDELRALALRARAEEALVLDAHSPIVWGSSTHLRPFEGIPETAELLEALKLVELSRSAQDPAVSQLALVDPLSENDLGTAAGEPANGDGAAEGDGSADDVDEEQSGVLAATGASSSLWAIQEVRGLPQLDAQRRGRPMHHMARDPDRGYLARGFAGIYVLLVTFGGELDELRAERAVAEALPRIERLVLALPPLDPTPEPRSNVISLRRAARR